MLAYGDLVGFGSVPVTEPMGAPHLARFSRDVGYHGAGFANFETSNQNCGIPHLAKNERDVGHPSVPLREKIQTLALVEQADGFQEDVAHDGETLRAQLVHGVLGSVPE